MTCWATSKFVSPIIHIFSATVAPSFDLTFPQKIRDRQLAAPLESEDLQSLARNELKIKKHTATEGLLWLVRYASFPPPYPASFSVFSIPDLIQVAMTDMALSSGLEFTSLAISQNLASPADELSTSFRAAYSNTLKPHHSFMIKPIFTAAMSATPYRKDFYAKLGDDQEQVKREMEIWLKSLETQVAILKAFLASNEARW